MLTTTSPSRPACSRATRINSACALCSAPMVGTNTRRFSRGSADTSAMVVRIFTPPALPNYVRCANNETQSSSERESKEEDKCAGDHQRKHPHQIDIEP